MIEYFEKQLSGAESINLIIDNDKLDCFKNTFRIGEIILFALLNNFENKIHCMCKLSVGSINNELSKEWRFIEYINKEETIPRFERTETGILVNRVRKLDKRQEEIEESIVQLRKEREAFKEICTHPVEYLENKSSYYPGNYLDRAYTEHWRECTLCGSRSETITEDHGTYG